MNSTTDLDWGNLTQNRVNSTGFEETNSTSVIGDYVKSEVPQWTVIVYFVIISVGTCVNLGVVIGLLRCKRKGVLLLILQLSMVDLASTFVAVVEIMSLQKDSWVFPPDLCPLFSGSEILTNSLTIYLIICLNFHVISVWNLHIYQADKGIKNPLTSCNDDDSNECLVRKNESPSSSRTLTIDYRRKKSDVSVIFPSLLIWFICLSLSIPEYTLASTIKIKNLSYNSTMCTIVDTYYGQLLQNLLLLFRAFIPVPLITFSFLVLAVKYCQSNKNRVVEKSLSKHLENTQSLIVFCMALTALYFAASLPRNVLYIMHASTARITGNNLQSFKTPPLHNIFITSYVGGFLSMLHYSCTLLRTFVYFICLPTFKKFLRNKIFVCAKAEE